MKLFMGGVSSC